MGLERQYLYPVDETATVRKTQWICVCPSCQCERLISYAQKWNIETGKNTYKCKDCSEAPNGVPPKPTLETQKKATAARVGIKRPKSIENCKYRYLFNSESYSSDISKIKQRIAKLGKVGELANNWQGGKVKERQLATGRDDYKQLRKFVFERDSYSCQICNKYSGKLEMDHIKEWCNYPELRYEATNCRTLCHDCHKKTDNYASKALKNRKS
jgi:hypothetical protein